MIQCFTGDHEYLSNFHKAPVEVFGIKAATNEHIFQAMKTYSDFERKWVLDASTPGEAKRRGRQVTRRPDWVNISRRIMLEINLAKYNQNPRLAASLVLTAPETLVEGNNWSDDYWGAVSSKYVLSYRSSPDSRGEHFVWQDENSGLILVGANWLGKILMMIREVIA